MHCFYPLIRCNHLASFLSTTMLMLFAFTTLAQIPKLNSNKSAKATAFLDFDGQIVKSTPWNFDGEPIDAEPAELPNSVVTEIFNRIAEDYRIFNINITTDSTVYSKAPVALRVRLIVTPTSDWYDPNSAGIAFVGSFVWGDDTPAWVFTRLMDGNPKYIGEAASHEIGHTLGLQHQSDYNSQCELLHEYAEGKGSGEIGWAPIMGVGYYKNLTTWHTGKTIEGCEIIQNDIDIISKGQNNIGLRVNNHSNTSTSATLLDHDNDDFTSNGMITSATDKDVFKIILDKKSRLTTTVIPNNVVGHSGANVDIRIKLTRSSGTVVGTFNPYSSLSASFDTVVNAGTYYLTVEGVANQNLLDYGSIGYYSSQRNSRSHSAHH